MNQFQIKAALILKRVALTDIANDLGCTVSEVSRCISGDGVRQRIREAIAEKLGQKVDDVFNDHHPQRKRNVAWCRVT